MKYMNVTLGKICLKVVAGNAVKFSWLIWAFVGNCFFNMAEPVTQPYS